MSVLTKLMDAQVVKADLLKMLVLSVSRVGNHKVKEVYRISSLQHIDFLRR